MVPNELIQLGLADSIKPDVPEYINNFMDSSN
jgi:hypothetical protein